MSDSSSSSGSGPFEEQRRIFDLLSQETRHLVVQYVLGHPEHLASLDELDYMIPKSKAAISDQLDNLIEAGILDRYRYEPSEDTRDLPSKFYGLTEQGVDILHEYNYLRGVPIARALYKNTRKSEKIERHEEAPRPELPNSVSEALSANDSPDPRAETHPQGAESDSGDEGEVMEIAEALHQLTGESGDESREVAFEVANSRYRLVEETEKHADKETA